MTLEPVFKPVRLSQEGSRVGKRSMNTPPSQAAGAASWQDWTLKNRLLSLLPTLLVPTAPENNADKVRWVHHKGQHPGKKPGQSSINDPAVPGTRIRLWALPAILDLFLFLHLPRRKQTQRYIHIQGYSLCYSKARAGESDPLATSQRSKQGSPPITSFAKGTGVNTTVTITN